MFPVHIAPAGLVLISSVRPLVSRCFLHVSSTQQWPLYPYTTSSASHVHIDVVRTIAVSMLYGDVAFQKLVSSHVHYRNGSPINVLTRLLPRWQFWKGISPVVVEIRPILRGELCSRIDGLSKQSVPIVAKYRIREARVYISLDRRPPCQSGLDDAPPMKGISQYALADHNCTAMIGRKP